MAYLLKTDVDFNFMSVVFTSPDMISVVCPFSSRKVLALRILEDQFTSP